MTAEVIILNKSAVAIAADSAATVGEGESGKVYNTVNKVFTLSKYHPVGVMVYANADYMGIPFETIIKMYRQVLGGKSEPKVEDYASKFTKYLGGALFSSEQQQKDNVRRTWQVVFDDVNDDLRSEIRREVLSNGDCPAKRRKEIIAEVSQFHFKRLDKAETFPGFSKKRPLAIVAQYKESFERAIAVTLSKAPNKTVHDIWRNIAGLAITKVHAYPTYSGIVVTGFGENEVFPQYAVTRMSGIASGVHKYEVADVDGITHDGSHSFIVPFAQSEMVGRFMDGVDRSYEYYVEGSMIRALRELATAIIDVHVTGTDEDKRKTRAEVEKSIPSQVKALREDAQRWRRERFVNPILNAVISLPKDELANLAEALVNLTSIKRRVSTERETVGGPIDVAVISKGDGFVWIKRKHYFRPEINPLFVPLYRKPTSKEDANGKS